MEGQGEADVDHHTSQLPHPHLLRSSDTNSRASEVSWASVTQNGRAYVHHPTQPPPSLAMDAVEMGLDPESLTEDGETTASSATTVVCDSRFFCATPDNADTTQLDSLDQDSGPENPDDEFDALPITPCPDDDMSPPAEPSPTGPSPTEPFSTGPLPTEPSPNDPSSTGPSLTKSSLTGSSPTKPSQNGPSPTGPSPTSPNQTTTKNNNTRPPQRNSPTESPPSATPHTDLRRESFGSPARLVTSPQPDGEAEVSLPICSINTDEAQSPRSSSPSFSSGMSPPSDRGLTPDLAEEQVEAYLDRHPHVVERWLRERTPMAAFRNLRGGRSLLQTDQLGRSWDSENRETPPSGTPTDNQHLVANYTYPSRRNSISSWLSPKSKKSKKVERLTEPELFMELIRDISTELDIDTLCHKILVNVGHLTHADRASLFLAQGPRHNRCLVAKLFDVTVDTVLEDALSNAAEKEILLPWGVGIVGHVANTKEIINIKDAYQDPRFDASIDRRTGYRTMSVLCMPVCNYEGEVIGVAEIINKKNGTNEFTKQDVEVFRRYLTFCGIGIQNAQLFDMSVREYKRNQLLLQLARGIFEEQTSLDRLVSKIMTEARELLKCERCSVYLLDPQTTDEDVDGNKSSKDNSEAAETLVIRQTVAPSPEELMEIPPETLTVHMAFELQSREGECRISQPSSAQLAASVHARLANYVCSTGQTVNISDVLEWLGAPLKDGGLVTHSVLTIPIFNSSRRILGVAQMINKESGLHFTDHDINTFEAFAIFCGLGIQNTQVYEKACRLMARQQVALECLSYHATASQDDTDRLRTTEIPTAEDFDLYNFDFCESGLTDDETCKCVIRMFMNLDLLGRFHIPYEVLCRWLLSVKKNYRLVKYHNWRHAVTVAQTMFAMLKTGKMERFMTDLEMLGLLVACLCHDLDHRGTNNSFQTKTDSPLAILYSTSTMEHHHFDQCVMILSQDSNNIFQVAQTGTLAVPGGLPSGHDAAGERHPQHGHGHVLQEEEHLPGTLRQRRVRLAERGEEAAVVRDDDDGVRRVGHRQALGGAAQDGQAGGRRVLRAGRSRAPAAERAARGNDGPREERRTA
ncbi:cGMP-specific 3',5'-cyclic phosphodiesterase isoform X2 [Panulirus ornatus]|uniref:cGMP-specific 3',5'-cyclic phosphodiesterase isoform X2 n=1 Tax=Panulirus ornatus TaxID=150431 RepID=UPI003A83C4E3